MTACCWCRSPVSQVRALLHFQACFPRRTPRWWGTGVPQIYPMLFMVAGRAPLFWETLVKGLGSQFSVHMLARDLLRCKSAWCLTPETQKRRGSVEETNRLVFRSCGCCTVLPPKANEYDKLLPTQFADKIPNQLLLRRDFMLAVHLYSLLPP